MPIRQARLVAGGVELIADLASQIRIASTGTFKLEGAGSVESGGTLTAEGGSEINLEPLSTMNVTGSGLDFAVINLNASGMLDVKANGSVIWRASSSAVHQGSSTETYNSGSTITHQSGATEVYNSGAIVHVDTTSFLVRDNARIFFNGTSGNEAELRIGEHGEFQVDANASWNVECGGSFTGNMIFSGAIIRSGVNAFTKLRRTTLPDASATITLSEADIWEIPSVLTGGWNYTIADEAQDFRVIIRQTNAATQAFGVAFFNSVGTPMLNVNNNAGAPAEANGGAMVAMRAASGRPHVVLAWDPQLTSVSGFGGSPLVTTP